MFHILVTVAMETGHFLKMLNSASLAPLWFLINRVHRYIICKNLLWVLQCKVSFKKTQFGCRTITYSLHLQEYTQFGFFLQRCSVKVYCKILFYFYTSACANPVIIHYVSIDIESNISFIQTTQHRCEAATQLKEHIAAV